MTQEVVNIGWIVIGILIALLMLNLNHLRYGYWVALLYPSIARILWSLMISFMILATTSQFESGEWTYLILNLSSQSNCYLFSGSKFLSHRIFEFLGRISFTTYCLNPLVIMIFVFSCEQAFHVDLLGLMPSIVGYYGVTILASLAFILLIEYPISRIIHSLL